MDIEIKEGLFRTPIPQIRGEEQWVSQDRVVSVRRRATGNDCATFREHAAAHTLGFVHLWNLRNLRF